MPDSPSSSHSREHILDVAERLFMERGYKSVSLRDIAAEVGIKHTSLYHHIPLGKQALFVEVVERSMNRHKKGLETAMQTSQLNIRERLQAAAEWLLEQPPLNFGRMIHSDMVELSKEQTQRIYSLIYDSIIAPLVTVVNEAISKGEIQHHNPRMISGCFVALIEGILNIPPAYVRQTRPEMAMERIDLLLNGIRSKS